MYEARYLDTRPNVDEEFVSLIKEDLFKNACGTGGFLTSTLNALNKQVGNSLKNRGIYSKSVYGIEKKSLPHMLCVTDMLIHDIDNPNILHGNALESDYKELRKMEPFDVIY
ncbi:N-6 DNA methylase [Peribacillus deserti]|uniref:N-6 DNA methylase n=1 Tax=Peribacillus deserti TaxID=673318 RepID=UPI001C60B928|nr:N-6 DNA methylase [Peribacillus deserti]